MNPVFQAVDVRIVNPAFVDNALVVGKWYFWDEVWTWAHGPYDTEDSANTACADYAKSLDSKGVR